MNKTFATLLFLVTFNTLVARYQSKQANTPYDVKKYIVALLDSVAVSTPSSIITATEWDELHLDMFLNQMDTTQTAFGSWAVRKLTCPTNNFDIIRQMQQVLKLLSEDKQLHQDLKRSIARIAEHEQVLIDYYLPVSDLHAAAQQLYYDSFFKEQLNKSKRALDGALLIDVGRTLASCGGSLVVNSLLELGPRYLFTSKASQSKPESSLLNTLLQRYNPQHNLLNNKALLHECTLADNGESRFAVWSQGSLGDSYSATVLEMEQRCKSWPPAVSYCASHCSAFLLSSLLFFKTLGHDVLALDSIKKSYHKLIDIWTSQKELRAAVQELVVLFQEIKSVTEQVKAHTQLASLPLLKQLDRFTEKCSEQVHEFIADVYSVDPAQLSYGQVLLLHKKMHELKDELVPLLQVVGCVDALLALIDFIKNCENDNLTVCFVEFVDHPSASVHADDFWLPLLQTAPVLNALALGYSKPNKVVLTGPNGGGKSTVMKSLCYLVVLGQSWGIAPAAHVTMTLFDGLKTSFYPQEDIQNQLSTFMAEKRRMELIQEVIDACNSQSKLLVAVDEPYRGTIESESASRVYDFSHQLLHKDSVLLLLATHLEKPTRLERSSARFVNYQLEHQQEKSGQFKRTFKLIPGAALWWFRDARKRAAFIESL